MSSYQRIRPDTPFEIRLLANGFMVSPTRDVSRGDYVEESQRFVFQSFAAMEVFLREHFTHRMPVPAPHDQTTGHVQLSKV